MICWRHFHNNRARYGGHYLGMKMKEYTLMGYTVTNAEQARTVLLVAKLAGRDAVAKQAMALIAKYEAQ